MSTKKTQTDSSEEIKDMTAVDGTTEEKDSTAESQEKQKKKKDKTAEELEKIKTELASEKDRYLRLLAEYDNFRKRSQKERENIYSDVRADTVSLFLPIYDNLERALKQETSDEAYSKGIEMIMAQLKEIMANLGVSEIDASVGTSFDPLVHNAVLHIEDESLGESVIVEEFQKGFMIGDKVIRYSVVKVAN